MKRSATVRLQPSFILLAGYTKAILNDWRLLQWPCLRDQVQTMKQ